MNNTTNYNVPQLISKSTYFNNSEIEAFWTIGDAYVIVMHILKEKKLYVWGRNADGQLGIGNTTKTIKR